MSNVELNLIHEAMSSPSPAHSLMELCRAAKVSHSLAYSMYQGRFGVSCGFGLAGMERVELRHVSDSVRSDFKALKAQADKLWKLTYEYNFRSYTGSDETQRFVGSTVNADRAKHSVLRQFRFL